MKIVIIMLIITVVAVAAFVGISSSMNDTANPSSQISAEDDPNRLMVTISGEVNRPGTYSLEQGSDLGALFAACGGKTANADELAYFEDITLVAKINYYIPPKYDNGDVCSALPIEKVNINSASAETLVALNGVSSTLSQSIVSYRQSKGSFRYVEQLMEVSGIGNATYNKLRNYVILKDA